MGEESYLVHDVLERVGAVDSETYEDDVRLGVRERPQPVVLFLSGGIPESQLDHLSRGGVWRVGDVVLEDSGHIFLLVISMLRWIHLAARTSGKLPEL